MSKADGSCTSATRPRRLKEPPAHTHTLTHTHMLTHIHTYTCTHTCTHTYTHVHTQTHRHTNTLTHPCTYTYTNYTQTHIQIHMYTCAHTCIYTYFHTCTHVHACTYTYTYTHTYIGTHTYTYTHVHTYIYTHILTHKYACTCKYLHIHIHTLTLLQGSSAHLQILGHTDPDPRDIPPTGGTSVRGRWESVSSPGRWHPAHRGPLGGKPSCWRPVWFWFCLAFCFPNSLYCVHLGRFVD